jgi:hypothetical protein
MGLRLPRGGFGGDDGEETLGISDCRLKISDNQSAI